MPRHFDPDTPLGFEVGVLAMPWLSIEYEIDAVRLAHVSFQSARSHSPPELEDAASACGAPDGDGVANSRKYSR